MPEFTLSVPVLGNKWAVGLAFQAHILIVAFVMGVAVLAPTAEWLGLRPGGERWQRLAHDLATTVVRLFALGATWAVFALMLIYGLYPRLFGVLTGIFFWPLLLVAVLWLVMTLTAYLYYETWHRLGQGRWTHMAIGWLFAGSTFLFISIITWLSSFQLTPGNSDTVLSAAVNPSWPTEIIHRHVGNLSYAALLLASYAGLRMLFLPLENAQDRAHADWLGDTALLLGVGLALLQPIAGWFYARQVQSASPGAYELMMTGANAWLFLVQSFFLGAVFLLGNLYVALAIGRGSPSARLGTWTRASVGVALAFWLLLIVPKEWPLGQMRPWKYVSLAGLVLLTLTNLVVYLRIRPTFVWGTGSRRQQLALAVVGVAIVALMATMGVIRTSARGDYLIYGQLGPGQAQQIERP